MLAILFVAINFKCNISFNPMGYRRITPKLSVKSIDDYFKEANFMVGNESEVNPSQAWRIALCLSLRDAVMEKDKAVEKEKAVALVEKEKARMEEKKDFLIACIRDKARSDLASVSQRSELMIPSK